MIAVAEDPAYPRLKNHLIASTGLAFYADRDKELTEMIGQRLSDLRLPDCSTYAELLTDSAQGDAEMDVLIARLTIGETSFFRDPEQFAAIRDIILPDILERKQSSKQLRIWSAGCATGAEPYSLAILLARELGDRTAGWDIHILATDLNRGFLAKAAAGKFRDWALRSTSEEVKRECFLHEDPGWTIHPRYSRWISFQQMNLIEKECEHAHFDLILCRNVMIYFSPEINRRVIAHFHQSLDDGGWLVVGAVEHNLEDYQAFSTVDATGARLYRKTTPATQMARVPEEPTRKDGRRQDQPLRQELPGISGIDMQGLRQLTDRGNWRGAFDYGRRLLRQDRLNPEIHFYQALIFENLAMAGEAERSLRHALYLDRNFALAHYHLGLALKRDGQMPAARRSFGNVLRVLTGVGDEATVLAGRGVTAIRLKELAQMHLENSQRT